MENLIDRAISPRRFLARAVGAFSLLALAIACLGVYGVGSYAVSRRAREIGIRMALGATAGDVLRQMLRGTIRLAAIGITVGTIVSLGLVDVMAAFLYETSPFDPLTFTGAALVLLLVTAVAAYLPARRAARCDPMAVLRAE